MSANTKGVSFMHVRAFTLERFGHAGWEAVLARLVHADREIVENVVLVGWYDLALYARLLHALEDEHGTGDLALVVAQGRSQAERDLSTIQRMFLRMANPAFAVEKCGEYWRRFHDSGTWEIKRIDKTHITGRLVDWGHVDRILCRELVGYMARTLELVGAEQVVMEHVRCRALGDTECAYRARWGAERAKRGGGGGAKNDDEPGAKAV